MPANTNPIYVGTPRDPQVRITTANTNRNGTGTLGTVYVAGINGSFFKGLRVQAEGTTTADVVRVFVQQNGIGNNELYRELIIPAITPSDTIEAASIEWYPGAGIFLGSGTVVYASTDQGNTYNTSLMGGGDF